MDIIKGIEEKQKRASAMGFNVGDTVKVFFKIVEGKTERIQVYEGVVIAKNGHCSQRVVRRRSRARIPDALAAHHESRDRTSG